MPSRQRSPRRPQRRSRSQKPHREKKKKKNNSRAQDDKIIVSPYADDVLPFIGLRSAVMPA